MSTLTEILSVATDNRKAFFEKSHRQNTSCYRLLHGTVEGIPGVTIDRYGRQLLIQCFHKPVSDEERILIADHYAELIPEFEAFYYHDRSRGSRHRRELFKGSETSPTVSELDIKYHCDMNHTGQDPLLFLDFRAARRKIAEISAGKTLLNCFSFSCGIGTAAAVHGATAVTNLDFAASALDAGRRNAELNNVGDISSFIQSDYFLAARQMAGLGIPGRQKQLTGKPLQRFEQQQFDIVVLDPPAWAKSKYGTVDLKRDYPSVLKPALLCVKDGGTLLCTNNLAAVERNEWQQTVERCITKNGRSISSIQWLEAEEDFPTHDGQHPLKQLLIQLT